MMAALDRGRSDDWRDNMAGGDAAFDALKDALGCL
jgi:hypothetical protein